MSARKSDKLDVEGVASQKNLEGGEPHTTGPRETRTMNADGLAVLAPNQGEAETRADRDTKTILINDVSLATCVLARPELVVGRRPDTCHYGPQRNHYKLVIKVAMRLQPLLTGQKRSPT